MMADHWYETSEWRSAIERLHYDEGRALSIARLAVVMDRRLLAEQIRAMPTPFQPSWQPVEAYKRAVLALLEADQ